MVLCPGTRIDVVQGALAKFYRRSINHNNGYEWLSFGGLSFAGRSCGISVCFMQGALSEVHWGVSAPDAKEKSWPSREDIDEELAFVRSVLSKLLSRSFASGSERFSWGLVWSTFDPKGFMASSGVRYV